MIHVRNLLAVLLLLGAWVRVDGQAAPTVDDDRQVYAAILELAIRPEVERFSKIAKIPGTPTLLVLEQTSSMCQGNVDRTRLMCVTGDEIERLRASAGYNLRLRQPAAYSATLRENLIGAFISRNAKSETFSAPEGAGVVVVPLAGLQEALQRRPQETVGYSAFSLPAYTDDGYAVVFAFYTCGGRCGRAQLYILNRTSGKWQVEAEFGLFQA